MMRGTTPTLTFTLPFECNTITKLSIAFAQEDTIKIEKDITSCQMEGKVITLVLTEEDTLKLDSPKTKPGYIPKVEIQLRVGCGSQRLASQIITVPVERILKDGCL